MQLTSGFGEIQIFRHRYEIPQVTQFHIVAGSLANSIALAIGQSPWAHFLSCRTFLHAR